MAYYTIQELARAPLRSFIRFEGSDGNYTALKLRDMILQVKSNGRYEKVSYPSLEKWCATLPEGAVDKLTLQSANDYQRHGTRMVTKKQIHEPLPLVKLQEQHTRESDIKLLTEVIGRLFMY